MSRLLLKLTCLILIILLGACGSFKAWFAREFMQENLADGIARLSTQHLAMITSELNKKFLDPKAQLKITQHKGAKSFGKGKAIWTLENILIEHPKDTIVFTDCLGENALWSGKVNIISASRVMRGQLTNNIKTPVIPKPGSIKIKVKAKAENLMIRFTNKEGYLRIDSGELEFIAIPRLAQSQRGETMGLRTVPTANTRFEQVKFTDVKATLFASGLEMPLTIEDSLLTIQAGIGENNEENLLAGEITLWGKKREVPKDRLGLNPQYLRSDFIKIFSCHEDLVGKISYDHVKIEKKFAQPVAGFSSLALSIVAEKLEDDDRCGLASPEVLNKTIISDSPGAIGYASNTVEKPCSLYFSSYQTKPNCFGKAYIVDGLAHASAQKKITGLIVASQQQYLQAVKQYALSLDEKRDSEEFSRINKPQASIPDSMQPAEVSLQVQFDKFSVREVCLDFGNRAHPHHCKNSGKIKSPLVAFDIYAGEAKGKFKPMLAKQLNPKDPAMGFCAAKVPVSEGKVELSKIRGVIIQGENKINFFTSRGSFEFVSGQIKNRENELTGEIKIGDQKIFFSDKNNLSTPLDPFYQRSIFIDSYQSCNQLSLPKSDEECKLEQGLAINVARMMVMNAGSILRFASSPNIFGSFASKEAIKHRKLENNENRLILKTMFPKTLDLSDEKNKDQRTHQDDLGNTITNFGLIKNLQGRLTIDGIRINAPIKIAGLNINIFGNRYAEAFSAFVQGKKEIFVRPTGINSTTINVNAKVKNFATIFKRIHSLAHDPYLLLNSASFAIKASPYMGIDERTKNDTHPSYSIPTPIIKFNRLLVENAKVILTGGGMELPIYVRKADLSAFNGVYNNAGNSIEGNIQLRVVRNLDEIPSYFGPKITFEEQFLNPDFEQDLFDKSYSNTPYLFSVLPNK
jgi:hypothetical protein